MFTYTFLRLTTGVLPGRTGGLIFLEGYVSNEKPFVSVFRVYRNVSIGHPYLGMSFQIGVRRGGLEESLKG